MLDRGYVVDGKGRPTGTAVKSADIVLPISLYERMARGNLRSVGAISNVPVAHGSHIRRWSIWKTTIDESTAASEK
jgi:hypothetical protein